MNENICINEKLCMDTANDIATKGSKQISKEFTKIIKSRDFDVINSIALWMTTAALVPLMMIDLLPEGIEKKEVIKQVVSLLMQKV